MRMLITAHEFRTLRGVQVFSHLVGKDLVRRGHDVVIYSPFIGGPLLERTRDLGVQVASDLAQIGPPTIDAAIVNGSYANACEVRHHNPGCPMVFVFHAGAGMTNAPFVDLGIGAYLAVSEESRDRSGPAPLSIELLRSPVDTDRFRPVRALREKPASALIFSTQFSAAEVAVFQRACASAGIEASEALTGAQAVFDVERHMNAADVIVTRGRGVVEAMACGRVVIIPGDGLVTRENIDEIQRCHFSGRRYRRPFTVEWLRAEIDRYDPAIGTDNRNLALERHGLQRQMDRLEAIMASLVTATHRYQPAAADLARLDRFVTDLGVSRRRARSMADALRRQETLVNIHRSRYRLVLAGGYNLAFGLNRLVPLEKWITLKQRVLPLHSRPRRLARIARRHLWTLLSR